jgi:catechol 2,3-dioxygenase-like lactoylglutathione lyase family enzyme
MMITFGRFLELTVPTRDILASLAFYRALGFTEWPVGEIRHWHYAVVTDGQIVIGLHQGGIEEPALTFVRPRLASQVAALTATGHDLDWQRLGPDEFHEVALRTPDGQLLLLVEARTFSPGDAAETTVLGVPGESIDLPCADVARTAQFLAGAGFLPAENGSDRWAAPGITLSLRAGAPAAVATVNFAPPDPAGVAARLTDHDLAPRRVGRHWHLTAPEGTRLVLGEGTPAAARR